MEKETKRKHVAKVQIECEIFPLGVSVKVGSVKVVFFFKEHWKTINNNMKSSRYGKSSFYRRRYGIMYWKDESDSIYQFLKIEII